MEAHITDLPLKILILCLKKCMYSPKLLNIAGKNLFQQRHLFLTAVCLRRDLHFTVEILTSRCIFRNRRGREISPKGRRQENNNTTSVLPLPLKRTKTLGYTYTLKYVPSHGPGTYMQPRKHITQEI